MAVNVAVFLTGTLLLIYPDLSLMLERSIRFR
jgi:hypothetical protein